MMKWMMLSLLVVCTGCSTLRALFERRTGPQIDAVEEDKAPAPAQPRTTRRSLEEESMLGESSGSLWSGRGQSAFLFTNNNQRLVGDLLNVNIDGYPKEQIQLRVNTVAKLLAQILNDQKQDIRVKEEEKLKLLPKQEPVLLRAPSSVDAKKTEAGTPVASGATAPEQAVAKAPPMSPESLKQLQKIEEEEKEVKEIQEGKEFPIRSVATHVVSVQKDGTYKVRGEKPFMIGQREYKLVVAGTVRPEDFDDAGVSAEILMEPTFEVNSDKKGEDL